MHERPSPPAEPGVGFPLRPDPPPDEGTGLDDPRTLQILATEHWSLLANRSLLWNESFARAGLFLSLLSASVVALSLMGTDSPDFLGFALILLPVTLFVGVATFMRLDDSNREDALWVAGMNRIRHAYVSIVPAVAARLTTGFTDDAVGIGRSFGVTGDVRYTIAHFFVTMPGMIAVVDAVLAAVITWAALSQLGLSGMGVTVAAIVVGLATAIALGFRSQRAFNGTISRFRPRFAEAPAAVVDPDPDPLKRM